MIFHKAKALRIGGLLILLSACGCGWRNAHADRMKELAQEVRSSSTKVSAVALSKLLDYSRGDNYWDKYYALVHLGEIARDNENGQRKQIIPVLIGALDDKDQAVRRDMVGVIRDIGSEAVDQALPSLLGFVKGGEENDVAWFAAEALGKSKDESHRAEIIGVLLGALDKQPRENLPDEAPQIRYYALSSLVEIGSQEPAVMALELKKRIASTDRNLSMRVAKAVARLRPN